MEKDKKYSPWPNFKPRSSEATLQDHTQHHAPVDKPQHAATAGQTQHQTTVRKAHPHPPNNPTRELISWKLNGLHKLRMQTDLLFRGLEDDASADITQLKHLAKTYDGIGTVLTFVAETGLLAQDAFKKGAGRIAKSKLAIEVAEKLLKTLGEERKVKPYADSQADKLLLRNGLQHHLGTAVHVWANFGPSYVAAIYLQTKGNLHKENAKSADRIANSRPEDLLADSLRDLQIQHQQTLQRIDQEILKAAAQLRNSCKPAKR